MLKQYYLAWEPQGGGPLTRRTSPALSPGAQMSSYQHISMLSQGPRDFARSAMRTWKR